MALTSKLAFEVLVIRAGSRQHLPQVGNLGSHRVPVDDRLVADVAGAGSIPQRVGGLLKVVVCWGHAGNHDCPGVASQAVLQHKEHGQECSRPQAAMQSSATLDFSITLSSLKDLHSHEGHGDTCKPIAIAGI